MKFWSAVLVWVLCCFAALGSAEAQTLYNPTALQFTSIDHAIATHYVAEFWHLGSPMTGLPLASYQVPVSLVTVAAPGPPIEYRILLKDILVFLPFGKSYVLRLIVCKDTMCSGPSEVTRETVRYTYCAGGAGVQPATLTVAPPPAGSVNGFVGVALTISAPKPVHSVNIALVGSGQPAYYFTGDDLRGTQTFTVGPLPRAGRYLLNVYAADEYGCAVQQATQYLTVR